MISLRTKIITVVIGLGLILIAIFKFGFGGTPIQIIDNQPSQSNPAPDNGEPKLLSTDPPELFKKEPLIITSDKVIELRFNVELENGPETKLIFDPPAEVEVKLSEDSKTAKIYPKKPYKLGQGYTLFIKPDTKLKGGKTLGQGYDFHFNIISYSGI